MLKKLIALLAIIPFLITGISFAESDTCTTGADYEISKETLMEQLKVKTANGKVTALPQTGGLGAYQIKIDSDIYTCDGEDSKSYKEGDAVRVYFQETQGEKRALLIQQGAEPSDNELYLFFRSLGIMGYFDGGYNPESLITRAELLSYAVKILSYQEAVLEVQKQEDKDKIFKDISNHWAYGYVAIAKSIGLSKGYSDGTVRPDENMEFEQLAAVVVRMLGYEPSAGKNGGYPKGYVKTAEELGLAENISGITGKPVTRGIAASILFKALPVNIMKQIGRKPVIYLYPEKEQEVSVKVDLKGRFTYTYPQYNNGWKVTAKPYGTIINKEDGMEYSYLFWEGELQMPGLSFDKGFVVKGGDTTKFLQEKLTLIGLTPRERNEFIVYWAPKMQNNKYNLITFAGKEYEEAAPLDISPAPDSILRVFMVYRSLEEALELEPQEIKPFERKGFTVVEWGGTEVN